MENGEGEYERQPLLEARGREARSKSQPYGWVTPPPVANATFPLSIGEGVLGKANNLGKGGLNIGEKNQPHPY